MNMRTTHRVAVVQAASVPFQLEPTMEKAVRLIREAGRAALSSPSSPRLSSEATRKDATSKLRSERDCPDRETSSGITSPAHSRSQAATPEACGQAGVFGVLGVIERGGNTLYSTVLFIDPAHGIVGKHRKLMPTGAEHLIWGCGDGSTLTTAKSAAGRVGAVICWENYMPMLRMAMYDKDVQIYCAPTADDRDTWVSTVRHIALEGRCYVLSACQHLRRGAFPSDYECALGDAPDLLLMCGGSMIVSPLGELLAGPHYDGEAILYADVDPDEIIRAKYDFDAVGHYARPDVFKLVVDEQE